MAISTTWLDHGTLPMTKWIANTSLLRKRVCNLDLGARSAPTLRSCVCLLSSVAHHLRPFGLRWWATSSYRQTTTLRYAGFALRLPSLASLARTGARSCPVASWPCLPAPLSLSPCSPQGAQMAPDFWATVDTTTTLRCPRPAPLPCGLPVSCPYAPPISPRSR